MVDLSEIIDKHVYRSAWTCIDAGKDMCVDVCRQMKTTIMRTRRMDGWMGGWVDRSMGG